MLARVPGPADRLENARNNFAVEHLGHAIHGCDHGDGCLAPQLTMFKLGAPKCSSMLATGTT